VPVVASAKEAQYGGEFFAGIAEGSRRSADRVAALIVGLFAPRSIVDVGGGTGHWAAAFIDHGVSETLTVDGPWVPQDVRVVSPDRFREQDLAAMQAIGGQFDLALCLEAAEHLPESAAPGLVEALTDAAPVIVFSAALPGQGGDGHINERLPSYWAALFAARGYACHTGLRSRIWRDEAIEVWYRQNLLCFVRQSELPRWRGVLGDAVAPDDPRLDVAHPELLARHKANAERLAAYADRLEADVRRLEREAGELRSEIDRGRADLRQRTRELELVVTSRPWRTWKAISRPFRRLLRQRNLTSSS